MNETANTANGPAWDIVVVGGGPAGMMAAGRAAERGMRVALLERGTSPGRKLLLTGGGRCNVTNAARMPEFLLAYGKQGEFLRAALRRFCNEDLREWLGERGVGTAVEEEGCVFPKSGGARAVLDALLSYMREGGVEVRTGGRAGSLRIEDGRVRGVILADAGEELRAEYVLVATGGLSYPATGCTGDGYELARQAGHTVVPPYAAVGGLELGDEGPKVPAGIAVERAGVRAVSGKRRIAEAEGTVLWTHHGVSGPAVLDVSGAVARALDADRAVELELDLAPETREQDLDGELVAAMSESGVRMVETVLSRRLPRRLALWLLARKGVDAAKRMAQLSRGERRAVVEAVKRLRLRVTGPRPIEEATVTGGGVLLSEVDPRTMESRLCAGLFFAGEVLDYYGLCGGFNLQGAFSTGRMAGECVGSSR